MYVEIWQTVNLKMTNSLTNMTDVIGMTHMTDMTDMTVSSYY